MRTRDAERLTKQVMGKVKQRRLLMGITQNEMADKLGIGGKQYMRYENGVTTPTLPRFMQILSVLGIWGNDQAKTFGELIMGGADEVSEY